MGKKKTKRGIENKRPELQFDACTSCLPKVVPLGSKSNKLACFIPYIVKIYRQNATLNEIDLNKTTSIK